MINVQKSNIYIAIIIIYSLYLSGLYLSGIVENPSYGFVIKTITYLTPLISIFFGYAGIKYFGLKSLQGKSILYITITLSLFLIADIIWSLIGNPVVSISDVLWLGGYLILYLGVFYAIRTVNPGFLHEKKRLLVTALLLLLVAILYFRYFPISWDSEITVVENIVTSGYILADLILAMFVITLLSMILSGSYSVPWLIFSIGAIASGVSDILYAINYDTYKSGDLIDLGWLFSYVFYAIAFILLKSNAEKAMSVMATFKKETKKKQ